MLRKLCWVDGVLATTHFQGISSVFELVYCSRAFFSSGPLCSFPPVMLEMEISSAAHILQEMNFAENSFCVYIEYFFGKDQKTSPALLWGTQCLR